MVIEETILFNRYEDYVHTKNEIYRSTAIITANNNIKSEMQEHSHNEKRIGERIWKKKHETFVRSRHFDDCKQTPFLLYVLCITYALWVVCGVCVCARWMKPIEVEKTKRLAKYSENWKK